MRRVFAKFLLISIFSMSSIASGKVKPVYNAEYIDQVIQVAQKSRTLKEFILKRNLKESPRRRFLLKYIKKHRAWKIPLIQRKKNVIHFQSNGFSAQLKVTNDQKGSYQLNGHELKFSKEEKTKDRIRKIVKILKISKSKKTGIENLILPKAFALWHLPVIATGLLIEEIGAYTLFDENIFTTVKGILSKDAVHLKEGRCKKDIKSLITGVKNLSGSQKKIISRMECTGDTVTLGMNKTKDGVRSTDTVLSINRGKKIINEHNRETGEFTQYVQNDDFTIKTVRYQSAKGSKGEVYNSGDWNFDGMSETYKSYGILYEKVYSLSKKCSCEDMKSVFYEAQHKLQFYEDYFGGDFKQKTSSAETQENSGVK